MENLILKINTNSDLKSTLFDIVSMDEKGIPKVNNTVFINISLSDIANVDEKLFSEVIIAKFIKDHCEALKVIPVFKFSSCTNQWYFEMSVNEFTKIRNWEMQQSFQSLLMAKYPVGRQLSLMNDKDYALLQLSDLTPFNPVEIMKKIQKVIPINVQSSLHNIKAFEDNINNIDFREQFACLQPTTFKVAAIRQWVVPVLEYFIYYFNVSSLRHIVYAEGKKLELCTTYEAVSLLTLVDPVL